MTGSHAQFETDVKLLYTVFLSEESQKIIHTHSNCSFSGRAGQSVSTGLLGLHYLDECADENENLYRHSRFPEVDLCQLWCFPNFSLNALVCWHDLTKMLKFEQTWGVVSLSGWIIVRDQKKKKTANQARLKLPWTLNLLRIFFSSDFSCCCFWCTIWTQSSTQNQHHRKLCDSCLPPCC